MQHSVWCMYYVMRSEGKGGLENLPRFAVVNARSENHFKTYAVQRYRGDKWKHDNAALKPTGRVFFNKQAC